MLLPPSEGKTGRARGHRLDLSALTAAADLELPRKLVLSALIDVCARPDAAAVLKVSAGLQDQLDANCSLLDRPAQPVAALYSGVLYDALDLASLDAAARRRANRRIAIQSALFGVLRLTDKVPPYRLSMGVNLPGIGPLAAHWREPLAAVMPSLAGRGLVVDCRSSTYAAAWTPDRDLAQRWVRVEVPGATHMAKHTRGLVTRALMQTAADPRRVTALPALLSSFDTSLDEPARPGQPWVLHAPAR